MGTIELSMLDLGLFIAVALFVMDYYVTKEKHEGEVNELKKLVKEKDAEIGAVIMAMRAIAEGEAEAVMRPEGFAIVKKGTANDTTKQD